MKTIITLFRCGPASGKEHRTDNISEELSETIGVDKPIVRLQQIFRDVRIFCLGTSSEEIEQPAITSSDLFWILVNLHINVRFITQYIDLCLEWGGFLVWVIFTFTNITVCTWLACIFTFLGSYSNRSYLSIWEMLPIFYGITYCVTIFEIIKVVETSLITSSGFMSFVDHIAIALKNTPSSVPIYCNKSKFVFEPAVGVPYEMSDTFTLYGHNPDIKDSKVLLDWTLNTRRVKFMVGIYSCVILLRILQFKRYRFFPLRSNMYAIFLTVIVLIATSVAMSPNPMGKIIQYDIAQYTNIQAYVSTIMFAIGDYMPMQWVTIGYLCPQHSLMSKIWMTSFIKVAVSFFLLFWIPFVAGDLMLYANVQRVECLQFFGMHFLFVMVPITLKMHWMTPAVPIAYITYFTVFILNGIANILIVLELFVYSFMTSKRSIYRYRNLITIIICLMLLGIGVLFCINNVHYFLFYQNVKSHYYSIMIISTITTLAVALYGLDRLNGDHLFMKGVLYPFTNSLKVLFLMMFALTLLFISQFFFDNYRHEHNNKVYWIIMGVCICPLVYGVWDACAHSGKYHGVLQPTNKWGMQHSYQRSQRRRKTLHTMYTYRMQRDCDHNCLVNNEMYCKRMEENLDEQEQHLGLKKINKLRLQIDRPSYAQSFSDPMQSNYNF